MLKRASLVAVVCVCASAILPVFAQRAANDLLVYIGTYTDTTSQGIYVAHFNPATAALSKPELAVATQNPSFLALTPDAKYLYAVNEVSAYGGKPTGSVSAYAVHKDSGLLTPLNRLATDGADPAHLSVDRDGHTVLVANYTGGSIASYPIAADGSLGPMVSFVQHVGKSVNPDRQTSPHAHQILTDPRNQFVYVADLGLDKVLIYRFDSAKHTFTQAAPPSAPVKPGAGPRHLAFDASGAHAYVINEMACTITAFTRNSSNGSLTEMQTISSLPPGDAAQPGYSTAEIAVAPSGKFLYGSTRGHDSISVYAVDSASGRLTFVSDTKLPGKTPRGFGITPDGGYMLVAHQNSDSVVVFRIDKATGKLAATNTSVAVGKPVDVKFAG
jgi:6-phosphogluconolactonase